MRHRNIRINRNLDLDVLVFSDSEDGLQRSVIQLQEISKEFNVVISVEKTKIVAFVINSQSAIKSVLYS